MTPLQACLKKADELVGLSFGTPSLFDPVRTYVEMAEGQEQRRALVLADAAARIIAPMTLGRDPEQATILRALPEIVDYQTAIAAADAARAANAERAPAVDAAAGAADAAAYSVEAMAWAAAYAADAADAPRARAAIENGLAVLGVAVGDAEESRETRASRDAASPATARAALARSRYGWRVEAARDAAADAAAAAANAGANAAIAAYLASRVTRRDRPWLALRDAMLRAACLDGVCCIHPECRGKDEEGVEGCSLMYPDFGRECLARAFPRKNNPAKKLPAGSGKEALVLMHVSSLDSLAWQSGKHAAMDLAERMSRSAMEHHGPVIIVDQKWPFTADSSARRSLLNALPAGAVTMTFDEDVSSWASFGKRLRARLRAAGVSSVVVGGLWYDPSGASGCATYLATLLRPTPVRFDENILACDPNESSQSSPRRNPTEMSTTTRGPAETGFSANLALLADRWRITVHADGFSADADFPLDMGDVASDRLASLGTDDDVAGLLVQFGRDEDYHRWQSRR